MTRPQITITLGRTAAAACPRCHSTLSGAAGIDDHPVTPVAGDLTLCVYCLTWLVYERRVFPASLTVRVATVAEIAQTDPKYRALAERFAATRATFEPKQ